MQEKLLFHCNKKDLTQRIGKIMWSVAEKKPYNPHKE